MIEVFFFFSFTKGFAFSRPSRLSDREMMLYLGVDVFSPLQFQSFHFYLEDLPKALVSNSQMIIEWRGGEGEFC